jgi:hypothetical protein
MLFAFVGLMFAVYLALHKDIGAVTRTTEVSHESRGLHCSEQKALA